MDNEHPVQCAIFIEQLASEKGLLSYVVVKMGVCRGQNGHLLPGNWD